MNLRIMETTKHYNLELSYMQLVELEVFLENRIKLLYENELSCSRLESLLKKVYQISPTDPKYRIHFTEN